MIKIKHLVKKYGSQVVLNDVSFKIKQGKRTTVIGPSGCGKSTLLRLILGLESFNSGDIKVDGLSIHGLNEDDLRPTRQRFGMVFQSSALFDSLNVGENVGLPLREHTTLAPDKIRKTVLEKLDLVGLADTYDHMPSDLSGGMKKRVAFARAIVHDPEILLFDEPTTGLDPVTSTRLEKLINRLTKRLKATTVVVTHQISTILNTSERIIMITEEGKAIKTEGPKKILKSENPVVYRFVNGLLKS